MKKKVLTVCLSLCMSFGAMGGGMAAFADVSLEECDLCFQTTVNGLLDESEVSGSSFVTQRRPVYDLHLQNIGYAYSFDTLCGEGYAIVIYDNGNYVTQEFVKSSESPYANVTAEDELCVYAYTMTYFKSVGEDICDIETSLPLSQSALDALDEVAFYCQTSSESANLERVNVQFKYTARAADIKTLCLSAPEYYTSGLLGACAAVAGGNLIGYYDRFYEDLIPNHTAGISNGDLFIYHFADDYVRSAIDTLYADMNGNANGITEDNFKSGMKKYCLRKGYTCDFTSLMSGSKINYNSVKTCINSGYPLVLFLNTYSVCSTFETNDIIYIYYDVSLGNHVMPGFGYRNITYTLPDGTKSEYKFIDVATGWGYPSTAYFNIEYCTNIIAAYKVNIY